MSITTNPETALTLEVDGVVAGYGRGDDIVKDVSVRVAAGHIVTLIGPNGSGKSTFIKSIAGLVPARRGRVCCAGTEVTALTPPQRMLAGLSYVPQEANVFPSLSVAENLALTRDFVRRAHGAVADDTLADLLAFFPDLKRLWHLRAGHLSGGQRQMLAFAAALLSRPRALLLDEPSAGLSPRLVEEIFAIVRRVSERGVGVLMVEQNVRAALALADECVVLVGGQVRLQGLPALLDGGRNLRELYLGGAAA